MLEMKLRMMMMRRMSMMMTAEVQEKRTGVKHWDQLQLCSH